MSCTPGLACCKQTGPDTDLIGMLPHLSPASGAQAASRRLP